MKSLAEVTFIVVEYRCISVSVKLLFVITLDPVHLDVTVSIVRLE